MSAAAPAQPTSQPTSQGRQLLGSVRRALGTQEGLLLILLVGLFFGVGLYNNQFLAWNNVSDLFNVNAYIAVAAIGMSMIIITGNIDISVGAAIGVLVTLSGYVALGLRDAGLPLPLVNVAAWVVPIFGGMLIGAVNGFFVAYLKIPPSSSRWACSASSRAASSSWREATRSTTCPRATASPWSPSWASRSRSGS